MNKNIDIYQNKAIKDKENKKNKILNNLPEDKNMSNSNEPDNKQLIHLDELVNGEGTTKYGEFISSYFAWTGLNRQKTRADELNNITKKSKKEE